MIPCQRRDELVLAEAFSKLRPLKYLDRRRFAHGLSAFEAMVQPNLEIRALLRSWTLLKLRPPEDLGLQMESKLLDISGSWNQKTPRRNHEALHQFGRKCS